MVLRDGDLLRNAAVVSEALHLIIFHYHHYLQLLLPHTFSILFNRLCNIIPRLVQDLCALTPSTFAGS